MKTPIENITNYYRQLASKQAWAVIYIVDKFPNVYITDLALLLEIEQQRAQYLCKQLVKAEILQSIYQTRKRGRMAKLILNPDVRKRIMPELTLIAEDPQMIEYAERFDQLNIEKKLLINKYGI